MSMTFRQGRIPAPTIGQATAAVREKLESEGWRVVRLSVRREGVPQPWESKRNGGLVWWEFYAEIR